MVLAKPTFHNEQHEEEYEDCRKKHPDKGSGVITGNSKTVDGDMPHRVARITTRQRHSPQTERMELPEHCFNELDANV